MRKRDHRGAEVKVARLTSAEHSSSTEDDRPEVGEHVVTGLESLTCVDTLPEREEAARARDLILNVEDTKLVQVGQHLADDVVGTTRQAGLEEGQSGAAVRPGGRPLQVLDDQRDRMTKGRPRDRADP